MPGGGSSWIGLGAFVAVKAAGYIGAAYALRKLYAPATMRSTPPLAGLARTGIGIVAGVAYWACFAQFLDGSSQLPFYLGLIPVRLAEWGFLIWLFFDRSLENRRKLLLGCIGGTLLSYALDFAAVWAAFVIPGGFWVC